MRKFLDFFLLLVAVLTAMAQKNEITSFTLQNGMNVLLCEDHEKAQIYGAVCVHAGSKNDPADNTGMAHYFEHIMFKGTDQIGTLDWASEKALLDEISSLYDQLHPLKDEKERNDILLKINELSNTATQFAIPNEVDVILSKMGGQDINAFTGNDFTVYHNSFPSNQLEKWLCVYKERFRNPVFRLFQTELETVYEEYNMYQDEPMSVFMEDALAAFYGDHPYGRPVIGYPEHLKNPQPSAMQQFFNTYYHPNNMTLILVGDFDTEGIKSLLEKTMGTLKNEGEGLAVKQQAKKGRMDTHLNKEIPPITEPKIVTVKETPIKMGIIGFQVGGSHSEDALYFDLMSALLNNEAGTGLFDQLNNQHKLMASYGIHYSMLESGVFALLYVPKLIGQSHEEAETLILAAIDSLRKGQFSDELFEAVKMDYLVDYLRDMESIEDKFEVLLDLVMSEKTPQDYKREEGIIRALTKEDIARVAQKYFADNYLAFRSFMGLKENEKLAKPNWKPIVAKNTDAHSQFAEKIEKMEVKDVKPQIIDFDKQVQKIELNDSYVLYSSENPYNDIFTLNIRLNCGTAKDPMVDEVLSYISMQGTKKCDYNEFQLALQKLGASLDFYAGESQSYIRISGFDKDLEKVMSLCAEKVFTPSNDESQLKIMIDERISANKMFDNDASEWGNALFEYAVYGSNSSFLARPSLKEMKKWKGSMLLQHFADLLSNNGGEVTYVGNRNPAIFKEIFSTYFPLATGVKDNRQYVRQPRWFDEPTVFVASNKKFLQSNIYFYVLSEELKKEDKSVRTIYNEYMGGSMASVIFQEIRELRSLGYSAYANFSINLYNLRTGFLFGFLGTQSDKTMEGCEAMSDLLLHFPEKPEKFEMAKTSSIQVNKSSYIDFRSLPASVISWQKQGYSSDPRVESCKKLESTGYEDVKEFYQKYISGRPMVITIAGDKNRMDMNALTKFGKVQEVSIKELIKK